MVVGASDGPLREPRGRRRAAGHRGGVARHRAGRLRRGSTRAGRRSPMLHRLFCYALTEDRWVLGGAINNAGSVVRWAAAGASASYHAGAYRVRRGMRPTPGSWRRAGQVPI